MIEWIKENRMILLKKAGILFGILLVIYFIFDVLIMPLYTRHGQQITVPDLANLIYEDAREQLDRLDLVVVEESKKYDSSNQFPIGTIMSQSPRPGATVKKGRRIYVIVSKGEPSLEMPQLVHRSERNAIFMVKNLGLALRDVRYDHSDVIPEGAVYFQNIPPGSEVKTGTLVDIGVSLGRFPDRFIVPALVGRSLPDAKKIIIQAGLTIGDIKYEIDENLLPNTIIAQSVKENEVVNQGDSIDLVVSREPDRDGGAIQ
ncbi:MAG: PASTA domain-containing protein [Candidatus Zhuqueibacterota bacterium]